MNDNEPPTLTTLVDCEFDADVYESFAGEPSMLMVRFTRRQVREILAAMEQIEALYQTTEFPSLLAMVLSPPPTRHVRLDGRMREIITRIPNRPSALPFGTTFADDILETRFIDKPELRVGSDNHAHIWSEDVGSFSMTRSEILLLDCFLAPPEEFEASFTKLAGEDDTRALLWLLKHGLTPFGEEERPLGLLGPDAYLPMLQSTNPHVRKVAITRFGELASKGTSRSNPRVP